MNVCESGIQVSQKYLPREVQFHGVRESGGWSWKTYSLRYQDRGEVSSEFLEWAKALAMEQVAARARECTVYGVGFLIAHAGKFGDYVLIQWWADEDILYSMAYEASPGRYREFSLNPGHGLTACVWELTIVDFERRAWVETVLKGPGGSDLDDYLALTFSGLV